MERDGGKPAMGIERFAVNDEFDLFDLKARCEFKTAGSVSFALGRWSDTLRIPRADGNGVRVKTFGRPCVWHGVGWVDVHRAISGPIKTYLRLKLPPEYRSYQQVKAVADLTLAALGVPAGEPYEATPVSEVEGQDFGSIQHNCPIFY